MTELPPEVMGQGPRETFDAALAWTRAELSRSIGATDEQAALSLTVMRLVGQRLSADPDLAVDDVVAAAVAAGADLAGMWGNVASVAQTLGLSAAGQPWESAGRMTARGWRRTSCCGLRRLAEGALAPPVCGDCPAQ